MLIKPYVYVHGIVPESAATCSVDWCFLVQSKFGERRLATLFPAGRQATKPILMPSPAYGCSAKCRIVNMVLISAHGAGTASSLSIDGTGVSQAGHTSPIRSTIR